MKALLGSFLITLVVAAGAAQTTLRQALKIGDKAPEFALPNGDGKPVALAELLSRGPVVVVFYRGYW
jgi:hypothetical protein